jgi:hypothetical protein
MYKSIEIFMLEYIEIKKKNSYNLVPSENNFWKRIYVNSLKILYSYPFVPYIYT